MRKKKNQTLLTEVELEMMRILWSLGEGTVHDVLAGLPEERQLKYTTVSTMLRILEQKNIVESKKDGRGHKYVPLMTKEAHEKESLGHLVSSVFNGEPARLVSRLVELNALSSDELSQIQKLLEETRNP